MEQAVVEAGVQVHSTPQRAPMVNGPLPYDIYAFPHKGLRAFMCETLSDLGRMDPEDNLTVQGTLAQVRSILDMCAAHQDHEDRFVHPAMQAKRSDSAGHAAADHIDHIQAIERLKGLVRRVELFSGMPRRRAALTLYKEFSLFVGENLVHMHTEETQNNQVLRAWYDDAELRDIERRILEAIPAQDMGAWMRWMVRALNPAERTELMGILRSTAASKVLDGLLKEGVPDLKPIA